MIVQTIVSHTKGAVRYDVTTNSAMGGKERSVAREAVPEKLHGNVAELLSMKLSLSKILLCIKKAFEMFAGSEEFGSIALSVFSADFRISCLHIVGSI